MKRISAVLLAAGESKRMGEVNKLTLEVKGQTLLQRTASTLLKLSLEELVVVTGHQADTARALLNGYPVNLVYNERYRESQHSSVHCGLSALRLPYDAVFICLTDLPLLEIEDLEAIVAALDSQSHSIVVPTFNGDRGNPVLFDRSHVREIITDYRDLGARKFIEDNPESVSYVDMPNDHVIFDVDTPAAYDKLMMRLGMPGVSIEPQNLLMESSRR